MTGYESGPICISIADDHPIVRQVLEVVLAAQDDMDLVAQATNGDEAMRLAQETQPDVIIMDLQMPAKYGLTAIREIGNLGLDAQILVLTSFPDDDKVFAAIKTGTMGFLLKDSPPEDLLDGIRTVHQGESALHPTVARKLIQEINKPPALTPSAEPLTRHELDVLNCLAQGLTNREIALELSVSVRTVTTHVRNILDKLHLANRTQAALYAVEQGLVSQS
jgi:NarL family two-component system response regulator LiaR